MILGLGRSLAEGNGNPLQYSCLGNPMDRGSLVGCSPWGRKESDMTEQLKGCEAVMANAMTGSLD